MKKYLLLCSALTVASSAYALDCATPPSCAELGYTMTEADCAGKFTLKCPFDNSKIFCTGSTSGGDDAIEDDGSGTQIDCVVGSIVYDDLYCYDSPPHNAIPVAVAINTSYKVAVALEDLNSKYYWSKTVKDTSLTNQTSTPTSQNPSLSKSNTQSITATHSHESAAGRCFYSLDNMNTLPEGSWFLPNISTLSIIHGKKSIIDTVSTENGGQALASSQYWGTNEYDTEKAYFYDVGAGAIDVEYKTEALYVRCITSYKNP